MHSDHKPHLTPEERTTLDTYERTATTWAQKLDDPLFWDDEITIFSGMIRKKGSVLDIGCGVGRDARPIKARGHQYLGIDISRSMIEEARRRNPDADFDIADLYHIHCPSSSFDGIWVPAVLCHIPKRNIDDVLKQTRRMLRSEGAAFFAMKEGRGERYLPEHGKDRRFFAYYQQDEFAQHVEKAGFRIKESYKKFGDPSCIWLAYFAERK
jgi:SAM-dependent methyltransferase